MDAFLGEILQWLLHVGPAVVFVVALAETAFFLGLLVPAEATVLFAAFLSDLGYFRVEHVLVATLAGGLLGDQVGYALGRFAGRGAAASDGRLGRLWARYELRAAALFRRRSVVSITLARFLSFVRTLMPWFAGMSGVPYPRFLFYDAIGVLGWGVGSVALGYAAGRSWEVAAGALGSVSALALFGGAAAAVLAARRRRATPAVRRIDGSAG